LRRPENLVTRSGIDRPWTVPGPAADFIEGKCGTCILQVSRRGEFSPAIAYYMTRGEAKKTRKCHRVAKKNPLAFSWRREISRTGRIDITEQSFRVIEPSQNYGEGWHKRSVPQLRRLLAHQRPRRQGRLNNTPAWQGTTSQPALGLPSTMSPRRSADRQSNDPSRPPTSLARPANRPIPPANFTGRPANRPIPPANS